MQVDFRKFERSLPYASELYGVYQPLLGWRSRRLKKRFSPVRATFRRALAQAVVERITPQLGTGIDGASTLSILPGTMTGARRTSLPDFLQSAVGDELSRRLAAADIGDLTVWDRLLSDEGLTELLQAAAHRITATAPQMDGGVGPLAALDRESQVAGGLRFLLDAGQRDVLEALFTTRTTSLDTAAIRGVGQYLGVGSELPLPPASVSPIGLVHLFRQYFFEFDSFLGPSVQHVWLTPGSTVELVEISTRRTLMERTTESTFETIQKSEKSQTTQDELSDAVKEENQSDTKFGVSVESTSKASIGIFSTELTAKASYESNEAKKTAKEQTHKQLRQQTTKLSSEIKQSFKSTFRTVVETTDTSSKRYLLNNTTDQLVNYELRRKMRQVGIQVQDMGTQLCWQAYIDRPGDELGVAKLVHIAQPPETNVQPAQLVAAPTEYLESFEGTYLGPDDEDFKVRLADIPLFPKHGYEYRTHTPVQFLTPNGHPTELTITQDPAVPTTLHLNLAGYSGEDGDWFPYRFSAIYVPTASYLSEIKLENDKRLKDVTAQEERLAKEAFFSEARDRVTAASKIQPRSFEGLREEERIVVYRGLVRQLFEGVGLTGVTAPVQHVLAELVQSLFDVDKMLYFVAPEWWIPRAQTIKKKKIGSGGDAITDSPEWLGFGSGSLQGEFDQRTVSNWGGTRGNRPDNYYITEGSLEARMGSSLGWVLQLDGDNLRNAFLNAPWVKAVVPIRPGREMEALDWLTDAGVEGSDGLDDLYAEAIPGERMKILATLKLHKWTDSSLQSRYESLSESGITIHDAIRYLAVIVHNEYELSRVKVSTALPDGTPLNYLPTDQVFEHGFDPLVGGFEASGTTPFVVFDQWIEVLPTDQLVAVQVHYDPKTGFQT